MSGVAGTVLPPDVVRHPSGVFHHGFFARSHGERLYAALYTPQAAPRAAVLVCPSWGLEASDDITGTHRLGHDLAVAGMAALVVQWPGTEDSEGDAAAVTLDRLVEAAADVRTAALERCPSVPWAVAGVRVGAAPAALLANKIGADRMLLVQPVLDLCAHFGDTERRARRAQLDRAIEANWAFGHPIPPGLRRDDDPVRVERAVQSFAGTAAVVRYRLRSEGSTPEHLPTITVRGAWRRAPFVDHVRLRDAAVRWLARTARRAA